MDEPIREPRRPGFGLVAGCAAVGFVVAVAAFLAPPDPELRLPREYRLAGLIERQQANTIQLRAQLADLREQVEELSTEAAGHERLTEELETHLDTLAIQAGLSAVKGRGMRVSLADSDLSRSPSENVNDLVIHSEDVRTVVNALWRAGAEAISLNGQRLVGTSAVVCVGNTLLVNGTVHSPPYVAEAVGADRSRFDADPGVKILKRDAIGFRLGFSVESLSVARVPGFDGAVNFSRARPMADLAV